MAYRQLWILIEGIDDENFVNQAVTPALAGKYDSIRPFQYATIPHKKITSLLQSINASGDDYLFLSDINSAPCITKKKERLREKYNPSLDLHKTVLVIKEIESWYLAGLDEPTCERLNLSPITDTSRITKEDFNTLKPRRFDSRIDFMAEILKMYSIDTAKSKNESFRYFMNKLSL